MGKIYSFGLMSGTSMDGDTSIIRSDGDNEYSIIW